jgi:hypothetical protein
MLLTAAMQTAMAQATINVPADQSTIQNAINAAVAGDIINVASGTFTPSGTITVNKDVTVTGQGVSTILQTSGSSNLFSITAAGATVKDLKIEKTDKVTQSVIFINASNVTIQNNTIIGQFDLVDSQSDRGMEIVGGVTGLLIDGNTFSALRQPAYINNGVQGTVSNNFTSITKGWVVVTDCNITFSGNSWGTGSDVNYYDIALINQSGSVNNYPDIVTMSANNNDAIIENQHTSYPSNILSIVHVDASVTSGNGSILEPYKTIMEALPRVAVGGKILVAAGTYSENVLLNKFATVQGAGPANTILTPTAGGTGIGVTISADNAKLKDLRITNFMHGITVSAATNNEINNVESVSNNGRGLELSDGTVDLSVLNSKLNNNTTDGFRKGTAAIVSGFTMDNCEVKGNNKGCNIYKNNGIGGTFDNVSITNSDFSNNLQKGMYFEALSNAVFDGITMDNSGTDVTYGDNNGININLKYGDYSNITIINSSITNCGAEGTATLPEHPAAIAITARDDGTTYGSNPATLDNVIVQNNIIDGPQNGIRFGESGQTNATPINVSVTENNLSATFANKAFVNRTSVSDMANCNWWGTTNESEIAAKIDGTVTFAPFSVSDGGACLGGIPAETRVAILGTLPSSCGTLDVPVTVMNFTDVGTISLKLNYDATKLQYTGVDLNSAISENAVSNDASGVFTLGYFGDAAIELAGQPLFTLHFDLLPTVTGGATANFTWNTTNPEYCEFAGPNGVPVYTGMFNDLSATIPDRPVKNTDTGLEYCTIQAAIDDATAGDEITVAAGTYEENLTVDKALTLKGANAGIACYDASLVTESIISGSASAAVTVASYGVTIDGFEITDPAGNYAISATGRSDLSIINNKIHHIGTLPVLSGPTHAVVVAMSSTADIADVTISDNCFSYIQGGENPDLTAAAAKSNNGSAFAIGVGWSNATYKISGLLIENNFISNVSACTSDWADGGKGAYGIMINAASEVTSPIVQNNTISDLSGFWAHGIGLEGNTPGASVVNNDIKLLSATKTDPIQDATGIMVEDNPSAAEVDISGNSFTDMKIGIYNATAIEFSASCNWYGTGLVDKTDGIASVNPIPWLTSGVNTIASPLPGFDPDVVCVACNIELTSTKVDVDCPLVATGSIDLTVANGVEPLTFSWTGPDDFTSTDEDPINLFAGTYDVTVTADNGCSETHSVTLVLVDQPAPVVPTGGASTVECAAEVVAPSLSEVTDACGTVLVPSGPVISAIPACEGDVTYTYTYTDYQQKSTDWVYTYTIDLTTPVVPADGGSTVECLTDAVEPVVHQLDQQQTQVAANPNWNQHTAIGQSIKCGTSGYLTTIDLLIGSVVGTHNFTLEIYEGHGIEGELLYSEPHSISVTGWQSLRLDSETVPYLTSGNTYTFWLTSFTYNTLGIFCMYPDVYSDGTAMDGCVVEGGVTVGGIHYDSYEWQDWSDYDLVFKTYMSASPATIPEVTDNCGNTLTPVLKTGSPFETIEGCEGTSTWTYIYTDCANNSTEWSYVYTIDDTQDPTITAPDNVTVNMNDGCTATGVDLGTPVVSDNCTALGDLVVEYNAPTAFVEGDNTVTWTVTDCANNYETATQIVHVDYNTLSGTVMYNNAAQSPMEQVELKLTSNDNSFVPMEFTTLDNGEYLFENLCAGTYSIEVISNGNDVGGINSTDAGAVNYWSVSGGLIEYVNFLAGDVNGDFSIGSPDPMMIQSYFVFGNTEANPMASFYAPWSYWQSGITIENNAGSQPSDFDILVSGGDVDNYDLLAMCTGDFNGSLTADRLKSASSELALNIANELNVKENQEFDLPLRAQSAMEVGAVSMILDIASDLVQVTGVKVIGSDVPVTWAIKGDELRIGWYSSNPVNVSENGNLVTLKLKTTDAFTMGQSLDLNLVYNSLNELADGNFEVICGAELLAAKVGNGISGLTGEMDNGGLLFSNYPNPFSRSTTLEYSIPVDGKVNINVYNQLGQLVTVVMEEHQVAGRYSIRDCGSNLVPGVYIAKLRLTNSSTNMVGTIKLNVLK